MKFKKCVWKAEPTDNVEYGELQTGSKFVSVKTETKIVREPIYAGTDKGKYINKKYNRDFLDIRYPNYDVNTDRKLAEDRNLYYLVVNHTQKTAKAVEKKRFKEFYSEGTGQHKKVKGDGGLMPDQGRESNPEAHARQVAKNKAKANR